jgi:TP901-1 family phage major tail protein
MKFKFDLQRHSVSPTLALATNPMAAQATVGKDYLLFIAGIIGSATAETWNILGGQTSGSIDETTDSIDVTTKTGGGYKQALSGLTSWSIDFDAMALMPGSDNGIELLKRAKAQKEQVKVKIQYPDSSFRVGWASSTTYTVDTPYDKAATLKGKLEGYGPLSSQSITASIAAAINEIAYFPSTATATGITYTDMTTNTTGTAVAADYTATIAGQITILGTYLATLTAGEYLFYINLSTGGYSLLPVVITA